jgi:hypothetical protein
VFVVVVELGLEFRPEIETNALLCDNHQIQSSAENPSYQDKECFNKRQLSTIRFLKRRAASG